MSEVLVVGAGGHAKVVIATLRAAGQGIAGVLDENPATWGRTVLGCPVLGGLELLQEAGRRAVIAIGNNRVRQAVSLKYPQVEWASALHPSAMVHETVQVGAGTVVFAGSVVQPDTVLGQHVIVNTGATVDHDGVLEDYVHVAPGSNLAGGVRLEQGAFLGTGSAVVPGVRVGAWTTVGAGGVVIKDLPAGVVAVGVPAKPAKQPGGEQR